MVDGGADAVAESPALGAGLVGLAAGAMLEVALAVCDAEALLARLDGVLGADEALSDADELGAADKVADADELGAADAPGEADAVTMV